MQQAGLPASSILAFLLNPVGFCTAAGGAAVASYMRNDPRSAMIKAGIAAAYIAAG